MRLKKRVILKLTGSLFDRGAEEVKAVAQAIIEALKEVEIPAIVAGGG